MGGTERGGTEMESFGNMIIQVFGGMLHLEKFLCDIKNLFAVRHIMILFERNQHGIKIFWRYKNTGLCQNWPDSKLFMQYRKYSRIY
jgi:hypothetical protein